MAVAYYTQGQIWATWTTGSTTTTIPLGTGKHYQYVWDNWVTSGTNSSYIISDVQQPIWYTWNQVEEIAQEDRDELQRRRERINRNRLEREQQLKENLREANEKAMILLYEVLTEEEQRVFEALDWIEIVGTDGQTYHLETHRNTVHGNIVRLDEHGCVLGRACVAPAMYGEGGVCPTADGWVGQYLGLKFDTEEFLSHANWSQVRRCNIGFELREVPAA